MVDFGIEYPILSLGSLCSLIRMLLSQLPLEIITLICHYLPLQDVKNVAQIIPNKQVCFTSVFNKWSKFHDIFLHLQDRINMIKSKNKLIHLYHKNYNTEQNFNHLHGKISPQKYYLHIMTTNQYWFQSSTPFFVKDALNYMLKSLSSIEQYYEIVNNNDHQL